MAPELPDHHGLRIARLQAVISGLTAAAVVAFMVIGVLYGATWAYAGAALVVLATPIVMALEMWLADRVHADDPAPRPSAGQRARALVGEWGWAWRTFLWNQPWRSRGHPDSADPTPRPGVLLVHGYLCNRGFWRPWLRDFERDGVPFATVDLEPPFTGIDTYAARIEAARDRLQQLTGHPPLIVAHSMGGLAVRAWLRAQGGAHRLPLLARHVITIGSPHHGTWLARWAHTPNGRQMRRFSEWLTELSRHEAPEVWAGHLTCVHGHCDNIVFPPATACLPGARVVHVDAQGHVQMAHAQVVRSLVQDWLDADPPRR